MSSEFFLFSPVIGFKEKFMFMRLPFIVRL